MLETMSQTLIFCHNLSLAMTKFALVSLKKHFKLFLIPSKQRLYKKCYCRKKTKIQQTENLFNQYSIHMWVYFPAVE